MIKAIGYMMRDVNPDRRKQQEIRADIEPAQRRIPLSDFQKEYKLIK